MYYPCSKAKYKLITPLIHIFIFAFQNIKIHILKGRIYIYYFVFLSPFLFHPIYFVLFLYRIRMREVLFFIIILFYWIEKASYFFFRPLTRRHKSTEVFKENNGIGPINWTYDRREKIETHQREEKQEKAWTWISSRL